MNKETKKHIARTHHTKKHIPKAIQSSKMVPFLKYGRILDLNNDEVWKRQQWKDSILERNVLDINRCHWGQLKLFYTELEFLTICLERGYDLSECVCVYVGSAPGDHIPLLEKLFPSLHWLLYDPAHFNAKKNNKVDIFSGDEGFFTDETVAKVLAHPFVKGNKKGKKRHILFISDIRKTTEEETIFEDMLSQQNWIVQLGAAMSMIKMRLPYTFETESRDWTYDDSKIRDLVQYPKNMENNITNKGEKRKVMWYLKGDIYVQLYPPIYSTETRLIIDKKRDSFMMQEYDYRAYEEKLFNYNLNIRGTIPMYYKKSSAVKNHIYGFNDKYDSVGEYYLIDSYLRVIDKAHKQPSFFKVVNLLYLIRNFHFMELKETIETGLMQGRTIQTCALRVIVRKYMKTYEQFTEWIEKRIAKENEILTLLKGFKASVKSIQDNSTATLNLFKSYLDKKDNEVFLPKQKYKMQIKMIEKDIRVNEIFAKKIIGHFLRYAKTHNFTKLIGESKL